MALSGAIVCPFGVKDVFFSFSNSPSAQDVQQAKNIAAYLAQFIRLQQIAMKRLVPFKGSSPIFMVQPSKEDSI